jgi:hypothetical protein
MTLPALDARRPAPPAPPQIREDILRQMAQLQVSTAPRGGREQQDSPGPFPASPAPSVGASSGYGTDAGSGLSVDGALAARDDEFSGTPPSPPAPAAGAPALSPQPGGGRSPEFVRIVQAMRTLHGRIKARGPAWATSQGWQAFQAVAAAPDAPEGAPEGAAAAPSAPDAAAAAAAAAAPDAGGEGGGTSFMQLFLRLSVEECYTLLATNLVRRGGGGGSRAKRAGGGRNQWLGWARGPRASARARTGARAPLPAASLAAPLPSAAPTPTQPRPAGDRRGRGGLARGPVGARRRRHQAAAGAGVARRGGA